MKIWTYIFSNSPRISVAVPKCLIYSEFSLMQGERWRLNFILLHLAFQFYQHHLLNEVSLLSEYFWCLYITWYTCFSVGLSLCLLFCTIGLYVFCSDNTMCFNYYGSIVWFEIWHYDAPCFTFLAKDWFGLLWVSYFSKWISWLLFLVLWRT